MSNRTYSKDFNRMNIENDTWSRRKLEKLPKQEKLKINSRIFGLFGGYGAPTHSTVIESTDLDSATTLIVISGIPIGVF